MTDLGMVWMSDVVVHSDPTQEILLDPRQAENPYFSHSFDDIRNHHIPPTAMVQYMTTPFHNECSESEDQIESIRNMQGIEPVNYAFYTCKL